jgi:hypothetical protein
MMDEYVLGLYWKGNPLTLRQYADKVREFLEFLAKTHPVFEHMEWVGEEDEPVVKLQPKLANLDSLVYKHAGVADQVYNVGNPDGTPSWASIGWRGFQMNFINCGSQEDGMVAVNIHAGKSSEQVFNSVTIQFPTPDHLNFEHPEFYIFGFIRDLFIEAIKFWEPEKARIFSFDFTEVVDDGKPYIGGWLVYVADPDVLDLRKDPDLEDFRVEKIGGGIKGALLSFKDEIVFVNDDVHVEKAKRLRAKLIAKKLV